MKIQVKPIILILVLYIFSTFIAFFTIEILSLFNAFSLIRPLFIFEIFIAFVFFVFAFPWKNFDARTLFTPNFLILHILNLFAFFSCVAYKPNNWDSMTYHLPRIEHWLHLKGLAPFPTDILRQAWEPPFGDYLTLIPRVILGNDNLNGLASFLALLIFELSVYSILRSIETARARAFSFLLLALSPIVVLEATTTQVDLRGTSFALAGIAIFLYNSKQFAPLSGLGLCIAAGIKITAVIPLASLLFMPQIFNKLRDVVTPKFFLFTFSGVLLNVPWLYRNFSHFGSITGPIAAQDESAFSILKIALSPGLYLARVFGLFFSNLGVPGFHKVNSLLLDISNPIINSFKVIDLPKSQYWPKLNDAGFGINEDLAPNLLLFLSVIFLVSYLLIKRQVKHSVVLLSPILIFCFIVEWQAFVNRFFISGFAAIIIISSVIMKDSASRFLNKSITILGFISVAIGILFVSFSGDRGFLRNPVFGENRNLEYFNQQPYLAKSYIELSDFIKYQGITRVDLRSTENSWEYPLWPMNPGVQFQKKIQRPQAYLCIDGCENFRPPFDLSQRTFGKTLKIYY